MNSVHHGIISANPPPKQGWHAPMLPLLPPPALHSSCQAPLGPWESLRTGSLLLFGKRGEAGDLGVGCVEEKNACHLERLAAARATVALPKYSHRVFGASNPNPTPPNPNPNPPHPSQPWHRQWIIKCPTCFMNRPNHNDEPLEEHAVC